ncbi:hypothetical protein GE21DRAFT_1207480 [Neurospora crassa]|nr:hypothetical protein B21J21.220 [imported] - Neurospora crassa [Neurospora crassa]KHE84910.1 hypothetical protein GE21DRAFT_1207480 [Neurospora crassa]
MIRGLATKLTIELACVVQLRHLIGKPEMFWGVFSSDCRLCEAIVTDQYSAQDNPQICPDKPPILRLIEGFGKPSQSAMGMAAQKSVSGLFSGLFCKLQGVASRRQRGEATKEQELGPGNANGRPATGWALANGLVVLGVGCMEAPARGGEGGSQHTPGHAPRKHDLHLGTGFGRPDPFRARHLFPLTGIERLTSQRHRRREKSWPPWCLPAGAVTVPHLDCAFPSTHLPRPTPPRSSSDLSGWMTYPKLIQSKYLACDGSGHPHTIPSVICTHDGDP